MLMHRFHRQTHDSLALLFCADHNEACRTLLMLLATAAMKSAGQRQSADGSMKLTRNPNCPSIFVDTTSMTVTLDLSTMHVISALAMSLSRLIKVPDASLRAELIVISSAEIMC